jgi:hypothetical protein
MLCIVAETGVWGEEQEGVEEGYQGSVALSAEWWGVLNYRRCYLKPTISKMDCDSPWSTAISRCSLTTSVGSKRPAIMLVRVGFTISEFRTNRIIHEIQQRSEYSAKSLHILDPATAQLQGPQMSQQSYQKTTPRAPPTPY